MKKYYVLTVLIITGLSLFIVSKVKSNSGELLIDGNMRVSVHTSYAEVPVDEQIEKADVIVAGTVTDISKTQWNQDSGEYWEEVVTHEGVEQPRVAVAYYTINVSTEQPLIAEESLSNNVEVTIVGMSPLNEREAKFPIAVGNKVVILATQSEMAWRDGQRSILKFLSAPEASLFQQGEDGLYRINLDKQGVTFEELVSKIADVRPDAIQR